MRIAVVTIFVFSFTCSINFAKAQQQLFKNYTVNDGLISNSIRRVFQDSKGFLWIATLEGLSKYDGNTFTNYTTANGLSHNMVNDFYETKDGQLYVALNNGSIDKIVDDKIIPKAVSSSVVINRFLHSSWPQVIATTDGNGLQNFTNGKLIIPMQDLPQFSFYEILKLNDTSFITTSDNYVAVFNRNYKLIAKIKAADSKFSAIKIFQDSKKRIWIASGQQLKLIKGLPEINKPVAYVSPPAAFGILSHKQININDIFEDEDGAMWFATSAGIIKINTDGSQQIFTVKDGLSSNIVTSIFEDKEKNIWFGTAVGLSKLITKSGIRLYPLENGIWSNDNLYLMYPFKKNNFLVSAFKGTLDFNKITGSFSPITDHNYFFYNVVANTNPPLMTGLFKTAEFDSLRMRVTNISPVPYSAMSRMIRDKTGDIFLSDITDLFFSSGNTLHKILEYRVTGMFIDKNNNLWVGTWQNGLFSLHYEVVDNHIQVLKKEHFLPDANIRALYEDSKGNIWAGTRYQGVYRLSKNEKDSFTILNFNQSTGLTSNFVKGIREDTNGNFWIAFYYGLDKLIFLNDSFHVFNFSRVNNYFASITGIETDDDNTLWLATGEGLVKIKDGELEKTPPLPVYITKIFSADSTYPLHAKKIQLNYHQNQVQFEYSAPGYINEKQILYSYRLSGSSDIEWSKAANQHIVSYAGLQPGKYRFEVRASGWNGAWGIPAAIDFVITPPFWKTWWFISLLSFCGFLLIYWFVKWRIKNIQTIAAEKLKVQQLNAEQYKSKLELEQIINYFSSSLIDKNNIEDVLWDVAKNLIGRLGFVDCMIYLWNEDKTKMIQKAGFGPKGSIEQISKQPFDVSPGQGVVGYVMQTKEAILIPDTSKEDRYRPDEMIRLSELTVPVIYNSELIGVIDSEHSEKNFFTQRHLQILNTIATLVADKIKSIEAEQLLQSARLEMYSINEQLSKARLEALRSQMNPHFIFNCINSIDALIQSNDKYNATIYLNKFAKLIRNILDSSKQNTVSLANDLDTLKLYIELEQFRHEDKFTAEIKADDELLQDDYKVPPLIIQPFVENAIQHGLRYRHDHNGKLFITISKLDNYLQYIVEDNGVGRNTFNNHLQKNKVSYGIDMSNERVKLFNNEEKTSVQITDLFRNGKPSGTKVEVYLKIDAC